ncbi:MAG TPA: WbuC family cupin fold metalloprotein [Candidatus Paceibacterota bacterium]|nr:WbuC family cupin fold metalloprotein [Candidatus Paceibacterota bacterium]
MIAVKKQDLQKLIQESRTSPRKRAAHIVRSFKQGTPGVMFNALQLGTYIRPHFHPREEGTEILISITGKSIAIIFDEKGKIKENYTLSKEETNYLEIPSRTFHTVIALEPDSVLCELYTTTHPETEYKQFASWAPEEGPLAEEYLRNLINEISKKR